MSSPTTKDRPVAAASHSQVAKDLGINFSMVSRLRTGKREPSVRMIRNIELVYGLKADAQVKAVTDGTFHVLFEAALIEKYGKKED